MSTKTPIVLSGSMVLIVLGISQNYKNIPLSQRACTFTCMIKISLLYNIFINCNLAFYKKLLIYFETLHIVACSETV